MQEIRRRDKNPELLLMTTGCVFIHSLKPTNHFHSTGIPTINHIQNLITKADESNEIAFIQDPIIPVISFPTKEGRETLSGEEISHTTWSSNLKMVQ